MVAKVAVVRGPLPLSYPPPVALVRSNSHHPRVMMEIKKPVAHMVFHLQGLCPDCVCWLLGGSRAQKPDSLNHMISTAPSFTQGEELLDSV
jgi:hypothetical protein